MANPFFILKEVWILIVFIEKHWCKYLGGYENLPVAGIKMELE